MSKNWIATIGILAAVVLVIVLPHTDKIGTEKYLIEHKYKPIEVGGYQYDFWGSRTDWYCTKFKAVDSNGDTLNGVVRKNIFNSNLSISFNSK